MAFALAIGTQQPIYEDRAQDVVVSYSQLSADEIIFTSELPKGWSFSVKLDGDQNGIWGVGSGEPKSVGPAPDRSFGLHADNKSYCFQHILTSLADDPAQVFASTRCGQHPSKGRVEIGALDARSRRTLTIRLPTDELFGTFQTARIGICVWDTRQMTCQYTLADPYILTRS